MFICVCVRGGRVRKTKVEAETESARLDSENGGSGQASPRPVREESSLIKTWFVQGRREGGRVSGGGGVAIKPKRDRPSAPAPMQADLPATHTPALQLRMPRRRSCGRPRALAQPACGPAGGAAAESRIASLRERVGPWRTGRATRRSDNKRCPGPTGPRAVTRTVGGWMR